MQRVYRYLPAVESLHGYTFHAARADILAGLSVAAVALPQAMAYAMIAGLPVEHGLYTAIVMTWEGWGMVAFSRMTGMMTELHPVPLWWIQILIPIGFVLMLAVAAVQLMRVARGLDAGEAAAEGEAARIKASPLE